MAIANDSGDEQIADNKFDDFTISEDELFFEDKDRNVTDLTTRLKQLLKIPNPLEHAMYPYNNPDYFLNHHNFTDSSDNEGNAIGILDSESVSCLPHKQLSCILIMLNSR